MSEIVSGFRPQFTQIKNLSNKRRMPRLGKIRLGIKVKKTDGTTYPKEVDYFVCPPEVTEVYKKDFPNGEIKELDIMFPVNDPAVVFPQAYKSYGSTRGLKCIGDGEMAYRFSEDKKGGVEIACPGPECEIYKAKNCRQRAHLQVVLPKVNLGGVYQIDLGSYHSIIDINSGIDYIRAIALETLGLDRFAWIPCRLTRERIETHNEGKKQTHYTLHIYPNITVNDLNDMKAKAIIVTPPQLAIAPPEDIRPEDDPGATIIDEEQLPAAESASANGKTGDEIPDDDGQKPPHATPQANPAGNEKPKAKYNDPDVEFEKLNTIYGLLCVALGKRPLKAQLPLVERCGKINTGDRKKDLEAKIDILRESGLREPTGNGK